MSIRITERVTNLTPYDVIFVNENGNTSALLQSSGVAHYNAELRTSPITAEIAEITGGTPVELNACKSFYCTRSDGSISEWRLPETNPGYFLLVTKDVARRANQLKIYRGIIFPEKFTLEGNRMIIHQLGTFWSHSRN